MPQEESVLLDITGRYGAAAETSHRRALNMRLVAGTAILALVAVAAVVGLTAQAQNSKVELATADTVARRLGYSLDRKPNFPMLEEEAEGEGAGEAIVAPVPAISAVAGAHAASRGAAPAGGRSGQSAARRTERSAGAARGGRSSSSSVTLLAPVRSCQRAPPPRD